MINDFIDDKPDWRIEYPTEDGMLIRYRLFYPIPEGNQIKVRYTKSLVRPLTGEEFKPAADRYYEPRLDLFYNMLPPPNLSYGAFASIHALNGMVARIEELGGNPVQPQKGHRVFKSDGTFYQPVVFDLEYKNATQGNADGSITINVVDSFGVCQYKLGDEGVYQVEPSFTDLALGAYKVFVKDEAGTERFAGVTINEVSLDGV